MASIYILGAGAMGSLWANHLHLAYLQTTLYSVQFLSNRNNSPKQISFSLNSPFLQNQKSTKRSSFELELPVRNFKDLNIATADKPNIILLCTKSYHAVDAALQLKPYLNEHSYLVLFQNGLGSQHKIIDALKNTAIYAAVSTEGVNRQSDGKLIHAGKGLTKIGPLNDKASEKANFKQCISMLTYEGLDIEANENIWHALWEKLAINCAINPFTAILNCPNGEIKNALLFKENWPALNIELTEMLNTAGIEMTADHLEQKVFSVIESTKSNISSMLQDVRANRQTEIDDINGFAAEYLEEKGLCHKVNLQLLKRLTCSGQVKLATILEAFQ